MDLSSVIAALIVKSCKHDDKQQAFLDVVSALATGKTECLYQCSSQLLTVIQREIALPNQDEGMLLNILDVLLFCLKDESIGSMTKQESVLLMQALFKCSHQSSSSEILRRILRCLTVQRFHSDAISLNFPAILDHIEEMYNKLKSQSVSALEEIVDVFIRLEEQSKKDFEKLSPHRWARLILPGLVNSSGCVRDKCLLLLQKYPSELRNSNEMNKLVIKAINAGLAQALNNLIAAKCEEYVMKAWALIVTVAGKELHKGPSINSLLEIIERTFKGTPEARVHAFIAWRSLVDNFAVDQSVISDSKRIKLIMMVLKVDNAKTEMVAMEKLRSWWHFIVSIGPKLTVNFEQVVSPLFQLCVGNGKLQSMSNHMGQTPRLALKSLSSSSPALLASTRANSQKLPVFASLQRSGCEVIAHILKRGEKPASAGNITWTLAPVPFEVLSGTATFVKYAPLVMTAFHELVKAVGQDVEVSLVLFTWTNLVSHLHSALESPLKTECKDVFSSFLSTLHSIVQNQMFQGLTLMKLIEISCGFPHKVLASTAYNITGGQTVRTRKNELKQGCPALLLSEMLLTQSVVKSSCTNDSFIKLFSLLMGAGVSNVQGALVFLQKVTEILDSRAMDFSSSEILWRMWSLTTHTLLDTINSTNEVNQGDSLEYNFDCVYAVLLFPIKQQLSSKVSQVVCKALVKLWKDVFHSFARLSALVATAEANACVEELCSKVLLNWLPEFKDLVHLEFLASVCHKMLDSTDFSALSINHLQHGRGLTLSPNKWARRRQRPMGNLHSLVHLLSRVQKNCNDLIFGTEEKKITQSAANTSASAAFIVHTLVEVYTKLFSHITTNGVISTVLAVLVPDMACLYQGNKAGGLKLFVPSFLSKLEKLWQEIIQCMTSRFSGQFDSELLELLSPLLEKTFGHSRRVIKNQTLTFWNATFSRVSSLVYPETLRPVLHTVKEKTSIILPGWLPFDERAIVAETPCSEMSMGESQGPPAVLPGMPSPKRLRGSMLQGSHSPVRRPVPNTKVTPVKIVSPKEAKNLFSSAWNKMAVDLMKDEEFVVINPTESTKKLVLTEHQKEVMKEKRALPAMYNNLELSQDVSLMSQLNTDTQQSNLSSMDVVINSCESQDSHKRLKTKKELDGSTTGMNPLSNESFSAPFRISKTGKRKSARIEELKDRASVVNEERCDAADIEQHVLPAVLPPIGQINESSNSAYGSKEEKMKQNSKEKDSNNEVTTSRQDASRTTETISKSSFGSHRQTSEDIINEGEINEESPFGMFRRNQSAAQSEPKDSETISHSQESVSSASHVQQRRGSLRKVQSEDNIPSKEFGSSAEKRTPRRVPLMKLSDHQNEQGKSSVLAESSAKQQLWPHTCDSGSTNLDKWVIKSNTKAIHSNAKPEGSGKVSSVATDLSPIVDNQHVPHTLAEDTQSPFKFKGRQATVEHLDFIAETPTKADTSSVVLKSVRKLFADGIQKCGHESNTGLETLKGPAVPSDDLVALSQGFETKIEDISLKKDSEVVHDMFGFSQLDSQEIKTETTSPKSKTPSDHLPESENLFVSLPGDECIKCLAPGSENESCQIAIETQFIVFTKDENSEIQASAENDSNKMSASLEFQSLPSLPIMKDDSPKGTPNRRKRVAPKKYSPVKRPRRAVQSKKKNECNDPTAPKSGIKSVTSAPHGDNAKNLNTKVLTKSRSNTVKSHTQVSPSESPQTDTKMLVQEEKDETGFELTDLKSIELSPDVGEVTPDMKSPLGITPQRHHSTAKRQKLTKRLSAQVERSPVIEDSTKPNEISAKVESENHLQESYSKNVGIEDPSVQSPKTKGKKTVSISGRKQSRGSPYEMQKHPIRRHTSPLQKSSKSRHMLRTRSKVIRKLASSHLSPPKKVQKLSRTSKGETISTKPCTVQDEKKTKVSSQGNDLDDDEDDDVPLSQLKLLPHQDHGVELDSENNSPMVGPAPTVETLTPGYESSVVASDGSENSEVLNLSPRSADMKGIVTSVCAVTNKKVSGTDESQDHLQPGQLVVRNEGLDGSGEISELIVEKGRRDVGVDEVRSEAGDVASDEGRKGEDGGREGEDEERKRNGRKEEAYEGVDHTIDQNSSIAENLETRTTEQEISQEREHNYALVGSQASGLVESKNLEESDETCMHADVEPKPGDSAAAATISDVEAATGEDSDQRDGAERKHVSDIPDSADRMASSAQVTGVTPGDEGTVVLDNKGSGSEINTAEAETTNLAQNLTEEGKTTLHDWSPSKSPSSSILKRQEACTPPPNKARRVSFAEPVVSGESPVQGKYNIETKTSPLAPPHSGSPRRRVSLFVKSLGRSVEHRRKLDSALRKVKEPSWFRLSGQSLTPSPQSSYKATQESQLDSSGPIFPDLVACTAPLDNILPQLTSSLWYRGLCQLMKGRNLNTIGDLSALTEVQVNQLPIRPPKVDTVKFVLSSYALQHGPSKTNTVTEKCVSESIRSKGATIGQEVTPSDIADEEIKILPDAENEMQQLSPIRDPESAKYIPPRSVRNLTEDMAGHHDILSTLGQLVSFSQEHGMKEVSTPELFDIHQKLNTMFTVVVEEMKLRQSAST